MLTVTVQGFLDGIHAVVLLRFEQSILCFFFSRVFVELIIGEPQDTRQGNDTKGDGYPLSIFLPEDLESGDGRVCRYVDLFFLAHTIVSKVNRR